MVDMFNGLTKISLKVIVQPKCTAVRKTSFERTNAKTHDRKMALGSTNLTKNFSAYWTVSGKDIFFLSLMQRVRENTPDELVTIPLWFQWTPKYGLLWKFSRKINKGNLPTGPRIGKVNQQDSALVKQRNVTVTTCRTKLRRYLAGQNKLAPRVLGHQNMVRQAKDGACPDLAGHKPTK